MTFKGNEHFQSSNQDMDFTVTDFWVWAYGDFTNNIPRSVLAEYIVAKAIGSTTLPSEMHKHQWRPFDLYSPDGHRVEVKSAAHVQSWEAKHPDRLNFKIAPARAPDENNDYKDNAPLQRNNDIYVFAVYKALTPDESPLNLDLWEFYVLATKVLDENIPNQKNITLNSLLRFSPIHCDFNGLSDAVRNAIK